MEATDRRGEGGDQGDLRGEAGGVLPENRGFQMNYERAIEILEMLLNGIDPVTGEILPEKGTHAEPEVIRALYKGIQALSREAKQEKTEDISSEPGTTQRKVNANRPWTKEDDQQLMEFFRNQAPIEEICAVLQRRPIGINNRLVFLGLVERTTDRFGNQLKPGFERVFTPWQPEEDVRLREMFNEEKTIKDMMEVFHRTENGIKYRLEKLQLIDDAENYPEESDTSPRIDNEDLRERFLRSEKTSQIASLYGQSEQAIRARLFYMGLGGSGPHLLPDRNKDK